MKLKEIKTRMGQNRAFGKQMADILRPGRRLWYMPGLDRRPSGDYGLRLPDSLTEAKSESDDANLVGSWVAEKIHAPIIDIDFFVQAVPSRTPGHFHLYFDRLLSDSDYKKLLDVLVEVGYVEKNYAANLKKEGQTFARLPDDYV